MRGRKGCEGGGSYYVDAQDFATDTCPRRHALRAPWVHAAWTVAASLGDAPVGLGAPLAVLDAVSTISDARAYRMRKDREAEEASRRRSTNGPR